MYFDEGFSFADISRKLHYSLNTVSKYIRMTDFNNLRKNRADAFIKMLLYEKYISDLCLKIEKLIANNGSMRHAYMSY
jgi:hypothetical protein